MIKHREYKKIAAKWRGEILNHAVEVELLMEQFIGSYFCNKSKKKRDNLINMVLREENLMLGKKIKICNKIFKIGIKEGNYKCTRVTEYLEIIRDIRNAAAHNEIDSTDFAKNMLLEKAILKSKKPITLSETTILEYAVKSAYCRDFFLEQIQIFGNPLPMTL